MTHRTRWRMKKNTSGSISTNTSKLGNSDSSNIFNNYEEELNIIEDINEDVIEDEEERNTKKYVPAIIISASTIIGVAGIATLIKLGILKFK